MSDVVGQRLRIVEVRSPAGRVDVRSLHDAWVEFPRDGQFVMSDSVNASSGSYEHTPDGLRIRADVAGTLVGYVGNDPVRTALINAVNDVARAGRVLRLRSDRDHVIVEADVTALICSR